MVEQRRHTVDLARTLRHPVGHGSPLMELTMTDKDKVEEEVSEEKVRLVNKAGDDAIRAAFLLNGGAAISWLALLSNMPSSNLSKATDPVLCFGIGAALVAISAGIKYLAMFSWAIGSIERGNWFNRTSAGLVILSWFLFLYGLYEILKVIPAFQATS